MATPKHGHWLTATTCPHCARELRGNGSRSHVPACAARRERKRQWQAREDRRLRRHAMGFGIKGPDPIIRAREHFAEEDRQFRKAYPYLPLRKVIYTYIGESPRCAPDDRERAGFYLRKIDQAIDKGGWTSSECGKLHKLRRVWWRRANGFDARFMVVGTQAGRLSRSTELVIQARQRILDQEWRDRRPLIVKQRERQRASQLFG